MPMYSPDTKHKFKPCANPYRDSGEYCAGFLFGVKMKHCHKCNRDKKLEDFSVRSSVKDGRASSCKECVAIYAKEYSTRPRPHITSTDLVSYFCYRDGRLFWIVKKGRAVLGDEAGNINSSGYKCVKVNGRPYLVHRLIFLMHHKYLPDYVDHIDRDPLNNRIENLRECTQSQNCMNASIQKSGHSEYKGVTWSDPHRKWRVQIISDKKRRCGGLFACEEDAARRYDELARVYHGDFAVLNFGETVV